ncbi:hypothetical protein KC337_g117 [Hortaea werneckii]|nr:hypothetical protein KC337_g117 [Hortaea werneckii]
MPTQCVRMTMGLLLEEIVAPAAAAGRPGAARGLAGNRRPRARDYRIVLTVTARSEALETGGKPYLTSTGISWELEPSHSHLLSSEGLLCGRKLGSSATRRVIHSRVALRPHQPKPGIRPRTAFATSSRRSTKPRRQASASLDSRAAREGKGHKLYATHGALVIWYPYIGVENCGRYGSSESSSANAQPVSRSPTASPSAEQHNNLDSSTSPERQKPNLPSIPPPDIDFREQVKSPTALENQLSPQAQDRVFPIRSVVGIEPTATPSGRADHRHDSYFRTFSQARRTSASGRPQNLSEDPLARSRQTSTERSRPTSPPAGATAMPRQTVGRTGSTSTQAVHTPNPSQSSTKDDRNAAYLQNIMQETDRDSTKSGTASERYPLESAGSNKSIRSANDETGGLVTARFKHIVTEGGHAIVTGRDGETLQRCEDEPIHIPGAVQGFGLLIALEEESEGRLIVRVVSENSKRLIGYTPKQLFALESFTDILSEEQADNVLDHVDFIRDEDADVKANGPEVFTMSVRTPQRKSQKMWCAMHINEAHPNLIICEFELEDDPVNPLVPPNDTTPEPAEDTLNSQPTEQEYAESTHNASKPLRVLRSARKRKGEAAAMEVFNIMSQVQEQLAAAPNLEVFLKILVGVIKELTGFHRVMIYQFDQAWNGRVVTELVDPRATKDLSLQG